MATADGLRDGRETSDRGDHVIADKLVPFDLHFAASVFGTSYGKPRLAICRDIMPSLMCIQIRSHSMLNRANVMGGRVV